jgi:hypothetical protein
MSGYATDGAPTPAPKDPIVRFLIGCGVVALVCLALVAIVVFSVGWQLTKDETPGRAPEALLIGDETRYWRVDLRADDPGLIALFARFTEINDTRRREILDGTPLAGLPIPSRQAHLDELAPLTFELGLAPGSAGWTGRGTFSHGVWKMRAVIKMMRWLGGKGAHGLPPIVVDGVAIGRVGPGLAVATVGNRVLFSGDAERLKAVLTTAADATPAIDPKLFSAHDDVRLDGEDAWAFSTAPRASASFDINDRDELAFRVAVLDETFDASQDECRSILSLFLPKVPPDMLEIDDGAKKDPGGTTIFTGRIAGVSKRIEAFVAKASKPGFAEELNRKREPETPSANPTLPSHPPPAGPRSGTPGGPSREGTPKPPR